MKKTLIAAGIATVVAAPVAFADVQISGAVEQQLSKSENGQSDVASDNFIKFAASEDLGNGLTAFASFILDADSTGNNAKDGIVGIKGGFGTVVAGRMEDFTEGKIQSRVTLESDLGAAGAFESNVNYGTTGDNRNEGIAYITPTVNGFHAGVAAYFDSSLANSTGADAYDVALFYDNGPISLAAARETIKGNTGNVDQDVTSLTGSYTMGDLKATVLHTTVSDASNSTAADSTDITYVLSYTAGANSITVGFKDDEGAAGVTGNDAWGVEVAHNFSKRTKIYASYADIDDNGDTSVAEYTTKVGLKHSF